MPLIAAHELDVSQGSPQVYNALDSALTFEVLGELKSLLPGHNETSPELFGPKLIYDFERALQAPAIEMMLRGWRIDPWARELGMTELKRRLSRLSVIIDCYAGAVWNQRSPTKRSNDHPSPKLLNPMSGTQLRSFFYDCMKIPPITKHKDGKETLPMDRETLEKLESYFIARPIIAAILAYRDIETQLEVFEAEVDEDWRMRSSFNMSSATTGRASSSKSITGSGRNLQNVEESLRYIFVADENKKLVGADEQQAETRETGFLCGVLFNDWSYLDSAESGDPHTNLARLIWPNLAWTGDPKKDRTVADQIYYRHHSYREVAKRGRHATEKGGQAQEISKQIRVPYPMVKEFQEKLFTLFPVLPKFFTWVAGQLQRERYLINTFGRRRDFFGRPDSTDTIKEAIAFMSQSPTADRTNLGLYRIWKHMGPQSSVSFELLAQLHDAVYGQRSELDTDEATVVAHIKRHLDVPMTFRGRTFTVPSEAKTGWCWANAYETTEDGTPVLKHADGLMKFAGNDRRTRANKIFGAERNAA